MQAAVYSDKKIRSYDISSIYANTMEKILLILEIKAEFIIA